MWGVDIYVLTLAYGLRHVIFLEIVFFDTSKEH
jgi:hypothetical protein